MTERRVRVLQQQLVPVGVAKNALNEIMPLIKVQGGSPLEVGLSHGKQLKERIKKTIAFYLDELFMRQWQCSEIFLHGQASQYEEAIRDYCAKYSEWDYAAEIDAIAEGAGVDPWKLYLINARTEVLCFLINRARKNAAAKTSTADTSATVSQRKRFSLEDLAQYDGIRRPEVFIAVKGKVYDVSKKIKLYGPGGSYHLMAGHDASLSLAHMKRDPSLLDFPPTHPCFETLEPKRRKTMQEWADLFAKKYPCKGVVDFGQAEAQTEAKEAANGMLESPTECTSLYSEKGCVLGQTWDWAVHLEGLTVVMELANSLTDHTILMVVEPGMIGKIGMNSEGVGVCLNVLMSHPDTQPPMGEGGSGAAAAGVPVHVLLRIVLDSVSLDTAVGAVHEAPRGVNTQSHFLIGNDNHEYVLLELNGEAMDLADLRGEGEAPLAPLHTNHYIGFGIGRSEVGESDGVALHGGGESSLSRYDLASEIIRCRVDCKDRDGGSEDPDGTEGVVEAEVQRDVQFTMQLLADRSDDANPICGTFGKTDLLGMDVGTVCSVVMELAANTKGTDRRRRMHVTRGNPVAVGMQYEVLEL
jgi:predicted heme/steroid binding protein